MNAPPMMKCGHQANAHHDDGKPVCAICIGNRADATTVDDSPPDLSKREAYCTQCGRTTPSDGSGMKHMYLYLPFFAHRPQQARDEFYCGCHGWD